MCVERKRIRNLGHLVYIFILFFVHPEIRPVGNHNCGDASSPPLRKQGCFTEPLLAIIKAF